MISSTFDLAWSIDPGLQIAGTFDLAWAVDPVDPPLEGFTGIFDLSWAIYDANSVTVILTGAPTGLTGVLTVSLITEDDVVVVAPTTTGVAESPAGTGRYIATLPVVPAGRYYVIWSDGTSFTSALLIVQITGHIEAA